MRSREVRNPVLPERETNGTVGLPQRTVFLGIPSGLPEYDAGLQPRFLLPTQKPVNTIYVYKYFNLFRLKRLLQCMFFYK